MFDFSTTEITHGGIIFCAMFYFFIVFKYRSIYTVVRPKSDRKSNLLFILVGIFSVFSWTNGDWFHYQYLIQVASYNGEITGMESFYEKLIKFVNSNFFLFRIVVWGGALFLLILSFRLFKVDAGCAVYLLLAVFINYFDYSRSALGIAVYFAGLSLLLSSNKIMYKAIGISLICAASLFHRSTMVLTYLTLVGFVPIRKNNILPIVLALLISFYAIKSYFMIFMEGLIGSGGDLAVKASFYMEQERESIVSGTIIGIIIGYWKYFVFYVYFGLITFYLFKQGNYQSTSFAIRATYNVMFGLFVFAILMYFFNIGHMAFYYRFLSMTYVPLIILSVYQFKNNFMPRKIYLALLLFGSGYLSFDFLYRCVIGA